jgi:predicted metal-dependent HD superfamily phosphohydrolase
MNNPFERYKNLLNKYLDPRSIPVLYKNWVSKDRKYHGISHLGDIIAYIERWQYRFTREEFEQLILAAFFHDAIYNTKTPDKNEDESIKFFRKSYIGKDSSFNLVDRAIECTKHRRIPISFPLRIFWQADNQIFKKSWEDYKIWEDGIRYEYSYVPDDIYIKHRSKFLNENIGKFGPRADSYIKKLIKQISDK